ncbi:isoleucine--tRNA ligase, partial [Archaeoglobales archaeon]
GKYAGIEVRKANDIIIDDLYSKNLLMVEEKIVHRYGHCWRCKTPIIYRATEQWFLKISELKDLMLREIEKVKWIPEWAGSARFRDWVAHAKDWCISRQRYWGIPLPIWVCDNCGKLKVLGSINEIPWKTDLDLHRPRIDEITFSCECGGVMRRIPDVFDVWFDSGVASWGSLGYPLDKSKFEELWPADFITEGHDQTRGWFYSQLGTSVMCFNRAPYKTVLMHGFTLDEQGRKMSKSLGNVVEPEEVIDQIGVDGFRLYVLSSAPWEDLRFSWDEARNINRLMNIIWNTVRFAYTYMKLDNYKFSDNEVKLKIEDKWILSRLERFSKEALDAMEEYHFHKVVRSFFDFLVEDFSRWYIQIIRSRVWEERDSPSKQAAYFAMFRIIDKSIRIIAPIAPFITEWLYQNFIKLFRSGFESIFLESYPEPDESKIDDELEAHMQIARKIVEASNNARNKAKRKLRWPLRELVVEAKDESIKKAVLELEEIIKSQANVKTVRFVEKFERKVIVKPNYKVIGPLLKDKVNEFVKFIRKMKKIPEIIEFGDLKLKKDEALVFEFEIPENYEFAEFPGGNVYIYTVLDDELIREAYAREIVRRIQEMRKELDLDVEEFIESYIELDSKIVEGWQDYIKNETRSSQLVFGKAEGYVKEWDIIGTKVRMGVRRIN